MDAMSTPRFELLTPVAILPQQFADGLRGAQAPEQRLLIALLEDAIRCFEKYCAATDGHSRRLFREAQEWIMLERDCRPFSFEHVCSVLGLDPYAVRRSLQRRHVRLSDEPTTPQTSHVGL
jgi:hypothetical protein